MTGSITLFDYDRECSATILDEDIKKSDDGRRSSLTMHHSSLQVTFLVCLLLECLLLRARAWRGLICDKEVYGEPSYDDCEKLLTGSTLAANGWDSVERLLGDGTWRHSFVFTTLGTTATPDGVSENTWQHRRRDLPEFYSTREYRPQIARYIEGLWLMESY